MNRLLFLSTILAIFFIGCTNDFNDIPQQPTVPGQNKPEDNNVTPVSIPNNEIWYTSYYGRIIQPNDVAKFGANILSNTYEKGKGIIVFDSEVSEIGDFAFNSCEELRSIVIPNAVTSIGQSAFYLCSRLSSITIPKSIQSIEDFAFHKCENLLEVHISDVGEWCKIDFADKNANPLRYAQHLYLDAKLVTKLIIPNETTEIGNWAFYDCDDITSISFSNNVEHIGISAFYDCNRLENITNSNNLTYIDSHAFENCTSLRNIVIPDTVVEIGDFAFSNCISLSNVSMSKSLSKLGQSAFMGCTDIKSIVISDYVEKIQTNTFKDCINLSYISIGSNVNYIGGYAFENCKNLKTVDISDVSAWCSVTFGGLYSNPLSYATELYLNGASVYELIIPNDVTYISDGVFQNCSNITSVRIPKSLTKTGFGAFHGSRNIKDVYIEDLEAWCNIEFGTSGGNPIYNSNLYLNNELVVDLVIPEGISLIGRSVFESCSSIKSVTIPNSTTQIGDMAFYECNNLTSVYCNATTPPTIGYRDWTFDQNAPDRKIYVYAQCVNAYKTMWHQYAGDIVSSGSAPDIENTTIHYTTADEKIIYVKNLPIISNGYYSNRDGLMVICGKLSYVPKDTFYNCENLTSIDIPDGVISIGETSFCRCTNLKSFVIPESVISIGDSAFSSCYNLETIYCKPQTPPIIADNVFFNNSSNLKIYVPIESIELYKVQWAEYSSYIYAYDFTATP